MFSLGTAYTIITALAMAAPLALAGHGPAPVSWFTVPKQGDGFESVSSKFFIDPSSTWTTGYYAATSWNFNGHDIQYFGLQPRSDGDGKTTGHLAYSVFGPGSAIGDPERCSGGADGGAGVSCALDIDFQAGRWYTIESTVVQHDAKLGRRWNGTFIDDATGERTYIASFWTNESYGKLSPGGAQWLEWYPFNLEKRPEAERECQPPFTARYGIPTAYVDGKKFIAGKGNLSPDRMDDKCAVEAGRGNWETEFAADNTLTIRAGILNK